MPNRQITNINKVKFKPFDNYGKKIPGMSWHKISYSKKNGGFGTYVLKMDAGARSLPHMHTGYEEFFMLKGELKDPDGKVLKKVTLYHLNQEQNIHPLQKKVVWFLFL
jgi:anti-sigma factor ChrR (cupin superfamily)